MAARMINGDALVTWIGCKVFDTQARTVGEVAGYYHDARTGEPRWLAVFETATPAPGTRLVPVALAKPDPAADDLAVAAPADVVFDSPVHDPGEVVSVQDERLLLLHYGLDPDASFEGDGRAVDGIGAVRHQHV